MKDEILITMITQFQDKILDWSKTKGFSNKFEFCSYSDFHNDEPYQNFACVTVLWIYGDPYNFLNGYGDSDLLDEFEALIATTEFDYDMYSESVVQFFCKDELLNQLYLSYFEWEWISKLIEPNYTSLYQEVFDYFNKDIHKLSYLQPRKFEVLIGEIFKNQGYYTELGAGWKDGGVDLRIYQKDDIDQIITLIQAKRHNAKNPIRLEAVAAFLAIVDEEKANRGLFITTSCYLPQAKKFAARQNKRLVLANSSDIGKWCDKTQTAIVRDKSLALKDDYILGLLNKPIAQSLEGKIVKNDTDIDPNLPVNDFCIILKDSLHVSLLMRIP